jgi:hypothetical protein
MIHVLSYKVLFYSLKNCKQILLYVSLDSVYYCRNTKNTDFFLFLMAAKLLTHFIRNFICMNKLICLLHQTAKKNQNCFITYGIGTEFKLCSTVQIFEHIKLCRFDVTRVFLIFLIFILLETQHASRCSFFNGSWVKYAQVDKSNIIQRDITLRP